LIKKHQSLRCYIAAAGDHVLGPYLEKLASFKESKCFHVDTVKSIVSVPYICKDISSSIQYA
jgi:hypothetical protein